MLKLIYYCNPTIVTNNNWSRATVGLTTHSSLINSSCWLPLSYLELPWITYRFIPFSFKGNISLGYFFLFWIQAFLARRRWAAWRHYNCITIVSGNIYSVRVQVDGGLIVHIHWTIIVCFCSTRKQGHRSNVHRIGKISALRWTESISNGMIEEMSHFEMKITKFGTRSSLT